MMDDRQQRHNNHILLHGRGRRKMAAATGDGQWTATVMTMMREHSRGRKEEENTMIEG